MYAPRTGILPDDQYNMIILRERLQHEILYRVIGRQLAERRFNGHTCYDEAKQETDWPNLKAQA